MRTIVIYHNAGAPETIVKHPYDVVVPCMLLLLATIADAEMQMLADRGTNASPNPVPIIILFRLCGFHALVVRTFGPYPCRVGSEIVPSGETLTFFSFRDCVGI